MPKFLPYGQQHLDERDIFSVERVLRSRFLTQGPTVTRFENALAKRVGAKYVVAVSSGTAALHVACLAAGMSPNDHGVTSALTFVASANAMRYCGAKVSLCDIDSDTLSMSPEKLEACLEKHPEITVIISVHFGGLPCRAKELRHAAGSRVIIEDAAQALGAQHYDGAPVGSCLYSDMTIFSFHPVKSITTAEGGAVATNDKELYHRLKLFSQHGIERDPHKFVGINPDDATEQGTECTHYYEQQVLGYGYRLSDVHAALGLTQLEKLDRFIRRRHEIVAKYDEAFTGLEHVQLMQAGPEFRTNSAHHLYIIWVDFSAIGTTRRAFMERLAEGGVGSQVHYIPVYRHPYYRARADFEPTKFPQTEAYYRGCLSIPLHARLSESDLSRVTETVRDAICCS